MSSASLAARARFFCTVLCMGGCVLLSHDSASAEDQDSTSTITVDSSPAHGAMIQVNGRPVGITPARLALRPGRYLIEVSLEGFSPWRKWLDVRGGESLTLQASLRAPSAPDSQPSSAPQLAKKSDMESSPASLPVKGRSDTESTSARVVVEISGPATDAWVTLDDQMIGRLPLVKTVVHPGEHVVRVFRPSQPVFVRKIVATAGQPLRLAIDFSEPSELPETRTREEHSSQTFADNNPRDLSSYSARLIPPRFFTADFSAGFAHFFEARITTGIWDGGTWGVDLSLEFRTFGTMTEIGLQGRARVLQKGPFSLAAFTALGGGGGPGARDTFFWNVGAVASMDFKRIVYISSMAYLNIYTDRNCSNAAQSDEIAGCKLVQVDNQDPRERFAGARFHLALVLEVPITDRFSAFALFGGPPFQSQRQAFTSTFSDVMPNSDPRTYARAGITLKF